MIYPESGFMAIPEGLARALQRSGVEILARHRVTRVGVGGAGGVSEVSAEGPSGIVRCAPDLVVSTLPIQALLAALDGLDVQAARAALQGVRFRSAVQVFLGVRRDRLTADHALHLPDGTVRFHRLSEMVNFAPRMAPRGATGLCAEIACDADDPVWSEGDAGQVRRAIDDLCFLGFLRSTGEVEAAWVRRDRDAEPVETQGHGEAVRAIDLLLAGIPNLHRCGTQGILPDPGAIATLRAGLETAAAAAAASPARAA
jgi:protoporphyrinogen oxidase